MAAAEEDDLDGLEKLLAYGASLHANGGGKTPAIARALHGRAMTMQQQTGSTATS